MRWTGFVAAIIACLMEAFVLCSDATAQGPALPGVAKGDSAAVAAEREAMGTLKQFLGDLFDISAKNVKEKALRIVVIFLIGAMAKLFMDAAKLTSRFLVFSEWGPLKYIYRDHQRSATMHALVINLLKYVVYFTVIGYILNELGVKYTTYLASLSLVGIAIGFGSQGLVQDVVTGFFILFENQFSIGDMVEISGHVGIVEEIGLRTTRLRNYFGAQVIFQNRNIPMAGRYKTGAFEVGVDVAIAGVEIAEKAAELLQQIAKEMEKQFREIIMETPRVVGLVELETRELFVRMRGKIWPLQQWVVDTQMVPRIREIFKREEIEIPADRVVAFYHFPEEAEETPWVIARIRRTVSMVTGGEEGPED